MITAEVVLDSVCVNYRLTTLKLRMPRYILPQFLTHRQFSRNAQSSRAMPIPTMVKQVRSGMVVPVRWGKYQKGMQCHDSLTGWRKVAAKALWKGAGHLACLLASTFYKLQLGKEIANRVLEPWAYVTVLVSATEWDNFFDLRLHNDAQPDIQQLAYCMQQAIEHSNPQVLGNREWHLPFITQREQDGEFTYSELCAISAARCARVSYDNLDGNKADPVKDMRLGFWLRDAGHLSPWEHVATPCLFDSPGNYQGWMQARHLKDEEIGNVSDQ